MQGEIIWQDNKLPILNTRTTEAIKEKLISPLQPYFLMSAVLWKKKNNTPPCWIPADTSISPVSQPPVRDTAS